MALGGYGEIYDLVQNTRKVESHSWGGDMPESAYALMEQFDQRFPGMIYHCTARSRGGNIASINIMVPAIAGHLATDEPWKVTLFERRPNNWVATIYRKNPMHGNRMTISKSFGTEAEGVAILGAIIDIREWIPIQMVASIEDAEKFLEEVA
jgi:hypothetical protein